MPPVVTTRPPTDEEQRLLRTPVVSPHGWWTGIVSAVCLFVVAVLMVLLASPLLPLAAVPRLALGVGGLSFLAWYAHVQSRERRALRRMREAAARDVAAGLVSTTTYVVRDAVAVEEGEDEGPSYYLLLEDGRTLFLSGQYLYEPAERGFPWTSFEIVRRQVSGGALGVVRRGAPLAPSRTRRPFSEDEYRSGAVPDDGAVAPRDFDALKNGGAA
jgi:hypothetical protein